jgi:hypothetical protein
MGPNGFTFRPKEVLLRIFVVVKNPSLSSGFEPASLVSSGRHDNHYTAENDLYAGK